MKIRPAIIPAVCLALCMGACVYSSSGIYSVEPVPGDPAIITVSTNLDTLIDPTVTDSLAVIYTVTIEKGELYFVESKLEDQPVYERTTAYDPDTIEGPYLLADTFWIRGSLPVDPGSNTLYMNFYYSSNTNSLGDIFNIEASVIELEYILKMEWTGP
jgi:hypothetical protein